MDLLQERSESVPLERICRLIGHEVTSFTVKSMSEFDVVCNYLSSIDISHDQHGRGGVPLCIHISGHGNEDGLGLGRDFVTWEDLCQLLQSLCTAPDRYDGKVFVVISACQAEHQRLTKAFERETAKKPGFRPPEYLFVTADDDLGWSDAVVSWTVFYHQLPSVDPDRREEIKGVLDKVKQVGAAALVYYRWDKKKMKYLRYPPK